MHTSFTNLRRGSRRRVTIVLGAAIMLVAGILSAAPVDAAGKADRADTVTTQSRFSTSDGVSLQTTLTGAAPMTARPTIVEFSPYGRDSQTISPSADFNVLLVQIRGTGDSDGQFDVMGPRTQKDVPEVLNWACHQPWSNGSLALNGFSASSIIVYNSMHYKLPCVKAMVLKSGTFDLYRDLLNPGGVSNIVPAAAVIAGIGGLTASQGPKRLSRNPLSTLGAVTGFVNSGLSAGFLHPTLDSYWKQRRFQGDVNNLPILMIDGFFDVESRGAFQAYQELRGSGAHLLVVGAHDGAPAGTDGGVAETNDWLDHYLRGVDNGVESGPKVQMLMSDGDREDMLAGDFVRRNATDWPVPGTKWRSLNLDSTRSHTAKSINDGTLTLTKPAKPGNQLYPTAPSFTLNSDPPNTAVVGGAGVNMLTSALPILSQMNIAETLGLSFTTAALSKDVSAAGPVALDVRLASSSPETAIWAVLTDVAPDGSSHPLTVGRLLSSFPKIDKRKSHIDGNGNVVRPYGVYSAKTPFAGSLTPKLYHVEFWPVGNRFKKGHRIRLDIVGASLTSLPTVPGINRVKVGANSGSRLLFPVLPGSDLGAALGQ